MNSVRPTIYQKNSRQKIRRQRIINITFIALLTAPAIFPLMAADIDIIPVNNNTALIALPNRVPIVNIATPNADGISYNTYQQFNIGQQGVILNNSTAQQTKTNLAGMINNNPNLIDNAASVIVNEVISSNPSELNGLLEVAGNSQEARVILINPYGITCDDCGFINTPHTTLTTGTSQFDDEGFWAGVEMMRPRKVLEAQYRQARGSLATWLQSEEDNKVDKESRGKTASIIYRAPRKTRNFQ